jgi:hypothetical protein
MAKSTLHGVHVAHAALRSAALAGKGLPLRMLIDIVVTVGEVGEGTAYQALRASIAPTSQYRAERYLGRWSEQVTITGTSLASQVWQLDYTNADRMASMRRELESLDASVAVARARMKAS